MLHQDFQIKYRQSRRMNEILFTLFVFSIVTLIFFLSFLPLVNLEQMPPPKNTPPKDGTEGSGGGGPPPPSPVKLSFEVKGDQLLFKGKPVQSTQVGSLLATVKNPEADIAISNPALVMLFKICSKRGLKTRIQLLRGP